MRKQIRSTATEWKLSGLGPKAERVDLDQFPLFETNDVELVPVDEPEVFDYNSNTKRDEGGERRAAFRALSELTVTIGIIDLLAHEKDCTCYGQRMTDIGEDVSKQIEYIPAKHRFMPLNPIGHIKALCTIPLNVIVPCAGFVAAGHLQYLVQRQVERIRLVSKTIQLTQLSLRTSLSAEW